MNGIPYTIYKIRNTIILSGGKIPTIEYKKPVLSRVEREVKSKKVKVKRLDAR
jgi:hypothetical protein